MDLSNLTIVNNRHASRWEARIGDQVAVLEYSLDGQEITYLHTGVPRALEGQGIGTRLVKTALDQARADNYSIIPRCPFTSAFIRRHPEYQDLVLHW